MIDRVFWWTLVCIALNFELSFCCGRKKLKHFQLFNLYTFNLHADACCGCVLRVRAAGAGAGACCGCGRSMNQPLLVTAWVADSNWPTRLLFNLEKRSTCRPPASVMNLGFFVVVVGGWRRELSLKCSTFNSIHFKIKWKYLWNWLFFIQWK